MKRIGNVGRVLGIGLGVCLLVTGCGSLDEKEGETVTASEETVEVFGEGSETSGEAVEVSGEAAETSREKTESSGETLEALGEEETEENGSLEEGIVYLDALGERVEFSEEEIIGIRNGECKVGVLNGSFAEIWSLAGGRLSAVTADAYDEDREILLDEETVNVGALKSPGVEAILEADIKVAVLSADIEEHVALRDKLEGVGVKTMYHSVETFDNYIAVLKLYTDITGCTERYEEYGEQVRQTIEEQLARQDDSHPTVLFIRAFSTGAKAKGSDSMTGIMLKELGCINIADEDGGLTDELSMEVIIEKNPDYIFVTTMGEDEEAALNSVKTLLMDNPAWSGLTAVQEEHYYVLPKNRFHNKPNARWGESYKMLADILYPESGN